MIWWMSDATWHTDKGKYQMSGERQLIVPLYKSPGSKNECSIYNCGILVLSALGKICGKVLTGRLMQVAEEKASNTDKQVLRREKGAWNR